MFATNSFYNSSVKPVQPIKSRQEIIVQINIGKKGQTSQIRLLDPTNINSIDSQIKSFIKNHSLKQTAFSFIKDIISKQISLRKQEIYKRSHSKCHLNCKCEKKMQTFQEKQKKILGVISLNGSKNKQSKSLQKKSKVQHLSIKINPKQNVVNATNQQGFAPKTFKSSSIQNEKIISLIQSNNQKIFQSDKYTELYQKKYQQSTNLIIKSNYVSRQNLSIKNLQASLNKNSYDNESNTNYQSGVSLYQSQSMRKSKIISTRQRKEAIMTPKKNKLIESQIANNNPVKNSQIQIALAQHKNNLKEQNNKIIKKILQSPLFPNKCIPDHFQCVIERLFHKLTKSNPPQINEIHSQYVSYQLLQKEQLQFMGVLFQKLNHLELNNLNYGNFRSYSLKYCWKELQQVVQSKKVNSHNNI